MERRIVRQQHGRGLVLAAICVALFLTMLDNTFVSVAMPSLQTDLHAGIGALEWTVASYILVFASLLLSGGTLGDVVGRRALLVGGLLVFAGGSVVCALAHSIPVLIAGRAIQGVGAAASEPATLSILRQVWPRPVERLRALGAWAAVAGIALAVGPLLGGVLTWQWGWRAVFWANVVLAASAIAATVYAVPESRSRIGGRYDILGQAFAIGTLGLISWGLIHGGDSHYSNTGTMLALVGGVACAAAFVVQERRARNPVLPLTLFADRAFATATFVTFVVSIAIFAMFFFVSLYLQLIADLSPIAAAGRFAPMVLGLIVAGAAAGRLGSHTGTRYPVALGLVIAAAGFVAVEILISPSVSGLKLGTALGVVGAGLGLTLAPATAVVLGSVEPERSGLAASISNLAREIGGLIGVGVLGGVVVTQLDARLRERLVALKVPKEYRQFIIDQVTHGTSPSGGTAQTAAQTFGGIVGHVVDAAQNSFAHGLHVALAIVIVLLMASLVATLRWLPSELGQVERGEDRVVI